MFVIMLFAMCSVAVSNATTSALAAASGWEVTAHTYPTNLPPGTSGYIAVDAYNAGAGEIGSGSTVTDVLPPGLTATGGTGCFGTTVVTCELPAVGPGVLHPVAIPVAVAPDASGTASNQVTVSGEAPTNPASTTDPIVFSSTQAKFGFADFDGWSTNADGMPDTQPGSHPYEMTVAFELNNVLNPDFRPGVGEEFTPRGEDIRHIDVALPPGVIGNPNAVPQCSRQQLDNEFCPVATQIGVDTIGYQEVVEGHWGLQFTTPVYNMVPPPGVPAQFAFTAAGNTIFLDAGVRSGGDYGITEHTDNIPQKYIGFNSITIWGAPAEEGHNAQRVGPGCLRGCSSGEPLKPFLTLPTSCVGPQTFAAEASTWEDPETTVRASFESHDSNGAPVGLTGCGHLSFGPSISIAPDTSFADTPAGLTADVKASQEGLVNPEGLSASNLKDTKVVLPQGVVINPGQAVGLQACQEAEAHVGHENEEAPACPNASRVGEDEIETPLLAHSLKGNVYILQSNPPNLRLLVAASGEGVNLKLVGDVHLDESTGQLTTTFSETPELPFTNFRLSFSGGARAALVTPSGCGSYQSDADFTPWSNPFVPDLLTETAFAISSGPAGGGCASPLPFSPTLTAGATTDQAGGFTNFSLLLTRGDGQQRISGLQFKAPNGLTGELANVPLCTNAQAEANACPEASKIGHTVVESGPGPYPLVVPEPGQPPAPVYLTEAYDGAPFGLSIVVPLQVGPFTLPTQRVRARIEVNPTTSALTITTGELPQVVAGVPTDLREVNAVIERPEFMINPTNCSPSEFSGTAYGSPPPGVNEAGESAPISSHFQVGACQALKFQPKLSVSATGKNSKAQGASLTAKVTYPSVPQGTESDIGLVKVELPKQLPSQLKTLQKACSSKQFEENPANCPKASKIGYATVHTPLLSVPLEGPAIFVSHGGEAFPSLTLVLQGDGVTVNIVGTTFISKQSITSTTFKTVPDDPFSSFELTLPQGEYAALSTNLPEKDHRDLCGQKLTMPNELIGQNGAVIKQSTLISITGCPTSVSVESKKVKGKTTTLSVYVPGAGKLTASGKGVTSETKTYSGQEAQTFILTQKKGGKLKTKVKLSFTPTKGKKQSKTVTVEFKK